MALNNESDAIVVDTIVWKLLQMLSESVNLQIWSFHTVAKMYKIYSLCLSCVLNTLGASWTFLLSSVHAR